MLYKTIKAYAPKNLLVGCTATALWADQSRAHKTVFTTAQALDSNNPLEENGSKAQGLNFSEFKEYYKGILPSSPIPSDNFLSWLIGFSEGDNCFFITTTCQLSFSIGQGTPNRQVLDYIKVNLGMGNVHYQKEGAMYFKITKFEHIIALILLFNGQIVLPTRRPRFQAFLEYYNKKAAGITHTVVIPYKEGNVLPSMEDKWLLGMTEAEGSFSTSFKFDKLGNRRSNFNSHFTLSQNDNATDHRSASRQCCSTLRINFLGGG
jgi:LAGLIDADG endonuclease